MIIKPTRDTGSSSTATKGELRILYDDQGRVRIVFGAKTKHKDVEAT